MFSKKYKQEMDNIKADNAIKNAIFEKLEDQKEIKIQEKYRRSKIIWRIGTAFAACLIIATAIWVNNGEKGKINATPNNSTAKGDIISANSYDAIYDRIKEVRNKQNINRGEDFLVEGSIAITDDIMLYSKNEAVTTGTNDSDAGGNKVSYTETNNQVEGVDEADIIKTDGKYIYALYNNKVQILKTNDGELDLINTLYLANYFDYYANNMYLKGDRLVITAQPAGYGKVHTTILDISDPANAKEISVCEQSGYYQDSRLIGDTLYLISNYNLSYSHIYKDNPKTYVPCVGKKNNTEPVPADSIYMYQCEDFESSYTVVTSYNILDGKLISTKSVLGRCDAIYCSTNNILATRSCYHLDDKVQNNYTVVTRFSIDNGNIDYKASARIDGALLNQFSMDEYDGNFRFVTTVTKYEPIEKSSDTVDSKMAVIQTSNTTTQLNILDESLKKLGEIKDLAPDERIYSVRFMGETAYFVTFRQTDPLFSADLSDPENPKIIGELKIPGFSNYLFPFGDGKLLGIGMDADEKTGITECMKLSMFDISDPANVTESDKTNITDTLNSSALTDHKASLVDYDRGLIGLSCYTDKGAYYRIYHYDGEFTKVAEFPLNKQDCFLSRGIIINNHFYLLENTRTSSYTLNEFNPISTIKY